MYEDEKVDREHRERMLKHLTRRKKVLEMANLEIPPLPPERVKIKVVPFDINTAPKHELDKELKRKQIKRTEALTISVELELARARGELIERDLAIKQLQYLMVTTRQRLLAIPTSLARQLQHKEDVREIHGILQRAIYEALNELKDLPLKVTDPRWLEKLDEEEEGK